MLNNSLKNPENLFCMSVVEFTQRAPTSKPFCRICGAFSVRQEKSQARLLQVRTSSLEAKNYAVSWSHCQTMHAAPEAARRRSPTHHWSVLGGRAQVSAVGPQGPLWGEKPQEITLKPPKSERARHIIHQTEDRFDTPDYRLDTAGLQCTALLMATISCHQPPQEPQSSCPHRQLSFRYRHRPGGTAMVWLCDGIQTSHPFFILFVHAHKWWGASTINVTSSWWSSSTTCYLKMSRKMFDTKIVLRDNNTKRKVKT